MKDVNYPNLFAELEEGARTAANLNATLEHYKERDKPLGVDLWAATMSRYVHLMFYLCLYLIAHSEWAAEVDCMLKPVACPAQRIPMIEQYLAEKGIKPNEGVALVVP